MKAKTDKTEGCGKDKTGFKRQKMEIDAAITLLTILVILKAWKWMPFPEVGTVRK